MLVLKDWKTPATAYPSKTIGSASIERIRYWGIRECYNVRGHDFYRSQGIWVRSLEIGDKTWMVDDPPHWWAIEDRSQSFEGHVLVAGLGLGLIVHALSANPAVKKITVVEISKDVIDLISPLCPKCEVVHSDFWDWGDEIDGVFFDLFVGDGRELIGKALRTYLLLLEKFGDIKISMAGFPDSMFDGLRAVI
jgi:hypothetical protein